MEAPPRRFRRPSLGRVSHYSRGSIGADFFADRTVKAEPRITAGEIEDRRRVVQHREPAFFDRAVEPDPAQPPYLDAGRQHDTARSLQQQHMFSAGPSGVLSTPSSRLG